jgi:ribonuclease BN (tRNA processing enzyme)
VRFTVLGGSGAFPQPGVGCSGYLIEAGCYRLLVDPGYATVGELMRSTPAEAVDAVYVSHAHPDHCADLNPLLRARALVDQPADPLPIYSPPSALDAVLALDRPGMLAEAYELCEFAIGDSLRIGPLRVDTWELPHFVPNAAARFTGDRGQSVVYSGDGGPSQALVDLAIDADLLVAEATYLQPTPDDPLLCDASTAAQQATAAGVGRLMLTHLWPGNDPDVAVRAAAAEYSGPLDVAVPGSVVELGRLDTLPR